MSLENANREPSPCRLGEGCHPALSNSHAVREHLGGVSEGDRTGRATRINRESSGGEAGPRPAAQGGDPAEAVRAAGAVGVPRSSADPPDSGTGGERRRGTCVNARGHGEGSAEGRTEAETLFERITTPPKVQQLPRALSRKAKAAPGISITATARGCLTGGTTLWRTGCNAGCGAKAGVRGTGG